MAKKSGCLRDIGNAIWLGIIIVFLWVIGGEFIEWFFFLD